MFLKETMYKDFVMPIKSNRKIAFSAEDKANGPQAGAPALSMQSWVLLPVL